MGIHIRGVRDLDGEFQKMLEVKLACDKAGIEYPDAVDSYFDGAAEESEEYLRHEMEELDITQAVSEEPAEDYDVRLIDLSKLPTDVKQIRVTITY